MDDPVIYKIRNLLNGKFYVGSTNNKRERFRNHRRMLRGNRHHCKHLQAAWNKYTEELFVFEVVEHVSHWEALQAAEDVWLSEHVGKPHCYNSGRSSTAPWRGVAKELHPAFGRAVSTEERAAISKRLKEHYAADPENHPRYGTRHTEETKQKISAKVRAAVADGRGGKFIPSDETRKKMSDALKGNKCAVGAVRTPEQRQQMSERAMGNTVWRGRTHTTESRRKMSKRIVELTSKREFESLSAAHTHYGMNMISLRRALVADRPITKGKFCGLHFQYALPRTTTPCIDSPCV